MEHQKKRKQFSPSRDVDRYATVLANDSHNESHCARDPAGLHLLMHCQKGMSITLVIHKM